MFDEIVEPLVSRTRLPLSSGRKARLLPWRSNGKDRDLGPAEQAEAEAHDPKAPVSVLVHLSHPVEPARVLTRKRRHVRVKRERWHEERGAQKRKPHLSAVRVAGELQVESSGSSAL